MSPRDEAKPLRYDSAPIRRERILDLVRESGYCALGELGRELGVSDMTVRRDVGRLARQGLVRVVHGGVSAVKDLMSPVEFRFRSQQHVGVKRAIAEQALTLVEPGSVIGVDAGTTVLELARRLPADRNLTVVTHSLPAVATLAQDTDIQLISLGGVFHRGGQAFSGQFALKVLSQLRIQTLFLGAAAVSDGRLWSTNNLDSEVKQAMIRVADRVVLLADSSKFAYSALMAVADLSEVDAVITDSGISETERLMVEGAGSNLIVVPSEAAGHEGRDDVEAEIA